MFHFTLVIFVSACAYFNTLTLAQNITSASQLDGQSPPVYPSQEGTGTGEWAEAYVKAKAFVAQLTLSEKQNHTFGFVNASSGCSGVVPAVPRLGFPGLCLNDNGNGIRGTDYVNTYPAALSVAASWNKELAYDRAMYMGKEFRTKGINVVLGPVVSPMGRMVLSGRAWESLGSDPWLVGVLAGQSIIATQHQGITACLKHVIANEQETWRMPGTNSLGETVAGVSSNVDDKTMHELYMWPVADAIKAGVGSIMCAYNQVNNSYSCGNSKLLNGLVKQELGFQGFVLSDWYAQHGGISTALAGLDMVQPISTTWTNLSTAISNGSLPEARLDDMVIRSMATWYLQNQSVTIPQPGIGMPALDPSAPHTRVNARDPMANQTIFKGAVEGHVLVKNMNGALPLKSPALLSVFGYAADSTTSNNPGGSFLEAYSWILGFDSTNSTVGLQAVGTGGDTRSQAYANSTLYGGGGSGHVSPPYVSTPLAALTDRAIKDPSLNLYWDLSTTSPSLDPTTDACLVFVNAWASEGSDRPGLHDDYSDSVILNVAAVCNNTIVIIQNMGTRLVDTFQDHPNITAILFTHPAGQDIGRATVAILFGDENPSGKLPYTVAMNESDYNAPQPSQAEGVYALFPQSDFTEGIYTDYRWFDARNVTPRYEFGYGLSYTNFAYSKLEISMNGGAENETDHLNATIAPYPSGAILSGGEIDLWDTLYTITAEITNIGSVEGAEVAQLYVGIPNGPVKQLRGFSKSEIGVGQSIQVDFPLMRRDLSIWDVVAQKWLLQCGSYKIYVGGSSRSLPLSGEILIRTVE